MTIGQLLTTIASSTNGLSNEGTVIANTCKSNQQAIFALETPLLNGVLQASLNQQAAYTNDVALRFQANNVLLDVINQQDNYLLVLQQASQLSQNSFLNQLLSGAGDLASLWTWQH